MSAVIHFLYLGIHIVFLDQGVPDFGNLVDRFFFFYMLSLFVSWTYKVRMDLFSSVQRMSQPH